MGTAPNIKQKPLTSKKIPFNQKSSLKMSMTAPLALTLSRVIVNIFLIMPQSLKVSLKVSAITTPEYGEGTLQKFKILFWISQLESTKWHVTTIYETL
jgi:hypothetical protein